jgi:hypothetical protein
MKIRTTILGLLAALALTAPAAQAAPTTEFVPWVTDFGKTTAVASPAATVPAGSAGLDWTDVSVGVGIGGGAAALLAGSALAFSRRARMAAHA